MHAVPGDVLGVHFLSGHSVYRPHHALDAVCLSVFRVQVLVHNLKTNILREAKTVDKLPAITSTRSTYPFRQLVISGPISQERSII